MTDGMIMRPLDLDGDAERLAAMWNASDRQWPGTFTGGVPFTAQRVREWLSREKFVEAMVWDAGEEIAGYCSLWKESREEQVYYIDLLNVAPKFQKHSLARKFLTYYVERVAELGGVRLDLHTWPGNLKAVPLYKKCGFFWMPKTNVFMLNFLPAILRLPAAQPFFAQHEWYGSFKRALTQEEDDERREGMKVFAYHFEEDGEQLTVWVDRQSRTLTAVETGAFLAAAVPAEIEPPRGLPVAMRWTLANKTDRPLSASLIASGDAHLRLDYRATLAAAPGESATREAPVHLAAEMPDVQRGDPAPALTSILIIDGQPLELRTGLLPRTAVEVDTFPADVSLTPGTAREVRLQLRSRIKRRIDATVSLTAPPGLSVDWSERTFALDAEGRAGAAVTLRAEAGGVYPLQAAVTFQLDGETVHLPARPLSIFALPAGGVLAVQEKDGLRIENAHIRLVVRPRGGQVSLVNRATSEWLCGYYASPVPPMEPSEYRHLDFALSLEHDGEGVTAVAAADSRAHPLFRFVKRLRVTAGPVVEAECAFVNLGAAAKEFQLCQGVHGRGEDTVITLPLASGVTRGMAADFPGQRDDDFKRPETFSERWMAGESSRGTVGAFWSDDAEEVDTDYGLRTLSRRYPCPPQSTARPGGMRLYVGDGDWRQVRQAWLDTMGAFAPEAVHPEPRPALLARLDPLPVVTEGAAEAMLRVEQAIPRPAGGTVALELPAGWQADRASSDFSDVNWQRPCAVPVRFTAEARPGAYRARIVLRSDEADLDIDAPLLRLGDGRAVHTVETEHEGLRVVTVDNGLLAFDVAPAFSGAVVALREGEVHHLASPFPAVGVLGWMSPWHGGVTPYLAALDGFPGKLHREIFTAEAITLPDGRGLPWTGVRQRAAVQHEEGRGLTVEMDALTLGGSPVVKLAMRVRNDTSAARRHDFGFGVYAQPDGSRTPITLIGPGLRHKHTERYVEILAGHWAAALNPATGRALALVSPTPRVKMMGSGADGGGLLLLPALTIPAHGEAEVVAFLALAGSEDEAAAWDALRELA